MLFFHRLELQSSAPPDVVSKQIESILLINWRKAKSSADADRTYGGLGKFGPYLEGSINAQSFHLNRNIHGRVGFTAVARGRIEQSASGSRIKMVLYVRPIVTLVLLFFIGIALLPPQGFSPFVLVPIVIVALRAFVGLHIDAREIEIILRKALGLEALQPRVRRPGDL